MTMKQILTITGPTCSGKSTVEALLSSFGYGKVISHTSRSPRPGEVNGGAYYFVSSDFFLERPEDFLERVEFDGNYYGVHHSEIDRLYSTGYENIVIVVEPNGVVQISDWACRKSIPHRAVFLQVDDQVRYERFLRRWLLETDIEAVIAKAAPRLVTMQEEALWKMKWTDRIGWDILRCTDLDPQQVAQLIAQDRAKVV